MRKPLPLERHREIAPELVAIRDRLLDLHAEIEGAYGKNSKACQRALRLLNALDGLRAQLDSAMFRQNPGDDELRFAYYPGNRPHPVLRIEVPPEWPLARTARPALSTGNSGGSAWAIPAGAAAAWPSERETSSLRP